MDQIKKKLAALKEEKELAVEAKEEAEKEKKEAEERADAVSACLPSLCTHWRHVCVYVFPERLSYQFTPQL